MSSGQILILTLQIALSEATEQTFTTEIIINDMLRTDLFDFKHLLAGNKLIWMPNIASHRQSNRQSLDGKI